MNDLVAQQNVLGDLVALERIEKFAGLMASARVTIPVELQNKPGDCLALCLQAQAWGMNPYAVAQKAHVIKGKLGYEAQLVNAVITRHAPIQGRLSFAWSKGWERILGKFKKQPGKNGGADYAVPNWAEKDEVGLWCEVSATLVDENAPRVLRLDLCQAHPRQSTLWATDPKQQLAYTVVKRWARLHCPDVILGIYTPEELRAMPDANEKDVTPKDRLASLLHGESVTARTESEPPPARSTVDQYIEDQQENTPVDVINAVPVADADKGEVMKQRVREKLRDNGQVADGPPSDQDKINLDMAIQCLRASQTMAELDEAGQTIKGVLHADHQEQARKVYREMVKALS
ncbi:RecT family recombinase [Endozoicomonas sp. SESOKO1]|uniref:RecT family recombinase n=1 Tax=Endozoicomonas sp. SESOKO1 TaxID=2828742 RepID=UPI0021486A67|nr:RecT family recombinase [Endozoicomonas sp. SESOKO1]